MSEKHSEMNRRDFFQRAGTGAALAGLGLAAQQAFARKTVEKADPHAPKTGRLLKDDETIGIAVIGAGGMGGSHVNELIEREKGGEKQQIRAVCDCYQKRQTWHRVHIKEAVNREIDTYFDYKKVLERDDIHAVVIATPDHWHSTISIDAMKAGKDVYCQKPVTLTIPQAVEVRDTAYATGRVFQCGSQRCSEDFFWQAKKFIEKGGIGKVVWAQADYSRNSAGGPNDRGGEWNYKIHPDASADKAAGEGYIDWEQWLGPAKKRPFSKARFFQFRKYWDYSGGIATDLLYHVIAPLTIALGVSAPERVSAGGGIFVQHDDREVPDTFIVTADYPEDCTLVLTSSMANKQGNPVMIRGHKATIRPHAEGMQVTAESEFKDWFVKEFGAEEIVVKNEQRDDHMTNFLKGVRNRTATHCDPETAYRAMAATKMGCDSWREDKVIFWDNAKEKYVNKHPRPNRTSRWPQEPEPTA